MASVIQLVYPPRYAGTSRVNNQLAWYNHVVAVLGYRANFFAVNTVTELWRTKGFRHRPCNQIARRCVLLVI